MTTADAKDLTKLPLALIFNEAAEQYRAAYPEQLNTLLVFSTTEQIYASPKIVDLLTISAAEVKRLIEKQAEYMRSNKGTLGWAGPQFINSIVVDCVIINTQETRPICVSKKYPQNINQMYLFDHEIGHLIVKANGLLQFGPSNMRECAADAYAALRHLQRYGDTTDFFEQLPSNRAGIIVARTSSIHYTSAAVHKVLNLMKGGTFDIQALSMQQTADIAGEIALRYKLDDETLNKIRTAFNATQELYDNGPQEDDKKDWAKIIESVVAVMHSRKNDHDIYRAGRLYLGCSDIKDHINDVARKDPGFMKKFDFMEQHEKDSGFILNAADAIDAKNAPAQQKHLSFFKLF